MGYNSIDTFVQLTESGASAGTSIIERKGGSIQASNDGGATFTPLGGSGTLPQTLPLADATTNTAPDGVVKRHTTSGTAAAGFGLTDAVELQNAVGTLRRAFSQVVTLVTPTDAAEVSKVAFNLLNAGALADIVDFSWPNSSLASMNLGGFGNIVRASASQIQVLQGGSNGLNITTGNVSTLNSNLQCDQRFYGKSGANVASATTITLGNDGNLFTITGATTITNIAVTGWTAGSRISLILPSGITITHTAAATSATVFLRAAVNLTTAKVYTLDLVFDGTQWRQPD